MQFWFKLFLNIGTALCIIRLPVLMMSLVLVRRQSLTNNVHILTYHWSITSMYWLCCLRTKFFRNLWIIFSQVKLKTLCFIVWDSCKQQCPSTAQKLKFSIMDFFSKYDQIRKKLRIWSHLLKKSVMENFIFYTVQYNQFCNYSGPLIAAIFGDQA